MIPYAAFITTFVAVWLLTAVYLGLMFVTARRLQALRRNGRVPHDTPQFFDPFRQETMAISNVFASLRWVFVGDHRALGDPLVSGLIRALRVVVPVAFTGVLGVMSAVFFVQQ